MFRNTALLAVLVGLTACSDSGTTTSAKKDTSVDQSTIDAAKPGGDQGATSDGAKADTTEPACGAGIYPCGPYGIKAGDIIENHSFMGFRDPKDLCLDDSQKKPDLSTAVSLPLKLWHRWDPACKAKQKKLLWILGSASWCGVCKNEVKNVQAAYQANQLDSRVAFYNVVIDGTTYGSAPTEAVAKGWVNLLGTTFPVAYDAKRTLTKYFTASNFPLNILVDLSTMKIYYAKNGDQLATIASKIQQFFAGK